MSDLIYEDAYSEDVPLMSLAIEELCHRRYQSNLLMPNISEQQGWRYYYCEQVYQYQWSWVLVTDGKDEHKNLCKFVKESNGQVRGWEACNSKRGQELVWAFDSFPIKGYRLERSVKLQAGLFPLHTG